MKKRISIYISTIFLLSACGGVERAEQVEAEVEAAQMQGRKAATTFVNTQWEDSLQLHEALLEASRGRAEYIGKQRQLDAYDSTFVATVKQLKPELHRDLFE